MLTAICEFNCCGSIANYSSVVFCAPAVASLVPDNLEKWEVNFSSEKLIPNSSIVAGGKIAVLYMNSLEPHEMPGSFYLQFENVLQNPVFMVTVIMGENLTKVSSNFLIILNV